VSLLAFVGNVSTHLCTTRNPGGVRVKSSHRRLSPLGLFSLHEATPLKIPWQISRRLTDRPLMVRMKITRANPTFLTCASRQRFHVLLFEATHVCAAVPERLRRQNKRRSERRVGPIPGPATWPNGTHNRHLLAGDQQTASPRLSHNNICFALPTRCSGSGRAAA
jgi:hypothetical protein